MGIKKIRFRKEYRLKGRLFLIAILLICFIFIPQRHRNAIASFFRNDCRNYQQVYSKKLNDRINDYAEYARLTGIEKCANENDLYKRIAVGKLVRIRNSRDYIIEDMTHSYPYLTKDGKRLLKEIAKRLREKTRNDGLYGSKFIITSMTRTIKDLHNLGKTNINASKNSPHLYGNAFDISYARFSIRKLHVKECDLWYMKEALAEIIWQLREEEKCWATYERQQGCFHVVSRQKFLTYKHN